MNKAKVLCNKSAFDDLYQYCYAVENVLVLVLRTFLIKVSFFFVVASQSLWPKKIIKWLF